MVSDSDAGRAGLRVVAGVVLTTAAVALAAAAVGVSAGAVAQAVTVAATAAAARRVNGDQSPVVATMTAVADMSARLGQDAFRTVGRRDVRALGGRSSGARAPRSSPPARIALAAETSTFPVAASPTSRQWARAFWTSSGAQRAAFIRTQGRSLTPAASSPLPWS